MAGEILLSAGMGLNAEENVNEEVGAEDVWLAAIGALGEELEEGWFDMMIMCGMDNLSVSVG